MRTEVGRRTQAGAPCDFVDSRPAGVGAGPRRLTERELGAATADRVATTIEYGAAQR
ncbi:hypothetical protein ACPXB5_19815 [Micromonospora arida]|uniref:hypothetical protein n=1 Tax=Micromonospora arida TaxID=2203715 RepID=UPI003CF5A4C6